MPEAASQPHPLAWRRFGEPEPKPKRRRYSSKNGGAMIRIKNRKLIFAWRERGLSGQSAACQAAICIARKRKGAEWPLPLELKIGGWSASSLRIRRRLIRRRLIRVRTLPRPLPWKIGDVQRLLQCEIEPRFRRDLHLLALGQDLYTRSRSAAHRRADRRAFAATGHCADERTQSRAAADGFRAALAAGRTGLLHVTGNDVVRLALKNDARQFQAQFAASRDVTRRAGTRELDVCIRTARHDDLVVHHDWRIQRSLENLSRVIRCRIDAVDRSNGDNRIRRNRHSDWLWRRWRSRCRRRGRCRLSRRRGFVSSCRRRCPPRLCRTCSRLGRGCCRGHR